MSTIGSFAMALVALVGVFGCSDDAGDGTASAGAGGSAGAAGGGGAAGSGAEAVSFAADIHPILSMKCSGSDCHGRDQGSTLQPGHGAADVDDAYDATQDVNLMGQPIYQRILARVTSADPRTMMPPNYANPPCSGVIGAPGCISEAELALLQAWVAQGALP